MAVKEKVLVTGASGFIAGHCILRLLQGEYAVCGSLRTPGRADEVRMALAPYVSTDDLSFVCLDLSSDDGWEDALQGCTYLQHVASPFPNANPEHEDELIVPGAVLGPLLGSDFSSSGELVKKLLDGSVPACPAIGFSCIDVRDVAAAHYEAMLKPVAAGHRYALVGSYGWMKDVSRILKGAGYQSPTKKLPNLLVHILSLFDKTLRLIKSDLGVRRDISNHRLRTELGIEPRSLEEMVLSMAETMVKFGVVKPKIAS